MSSVVNPWNTRDGEKVTKQLDKLKKQWAEQTTEYLVNIAETKLPYTELNTSHQHSLLPYSRVKSMNAKFFMLIEKEPSNKELFIKVQVDENADPLHGDAIVLYSLQRYFEDRKELVLFKDHFLQFKYAGCLFVETQGLNHFVAFNPKDQGDDDKIEIAFCLVCNGLKQPFSLLDLMNNLEFNDTLGDMLNLVGSSLNYNQWYVFERLSALFEALLYVGAQTKFTHNDLHLANILWDIQTQKFVVIDYGRSYIDIPEDVNFRVELSNIVQRCSGIWPQLTQFSKYYEKTNRISNEGDYPQGIPRLAPNLRNICLPVLFDIASVSMNVLMNKLKYTYRDALLSMFNGLFWMGTYNGFESFVVPKTKTLIENFTPQDVLTDYTEDEVSVLRQMSYTLSYGVVWFILGLNYIAQQCNFVFDTTTYTYTLDSVFITEALITSTETFAEDSIKSEDLIHYYVIPIHFVFKHMVNRETFVYLHASPVMRFMVTNWTPQFSFCIPAECHSSNNNQTTKRYRGDNESSDSDPKFQKKGGRHKQQKGGCVLRTRTTDSPKDGVGKRGSRHLEAISLEKTMDQYRTIFQSPLGVIRPPALVKRPLETGGGKASKLMYQKKWRTVHRDKRGKYIVWDKEKLYLSSIKGRYRYKK